MKGNMKISVVEVGSTIAIEDGTARRFLVKLEDHGCCGFGGWSGGGCRVCCGLFDRGKNLKRWAQLLLAVAHRLFYC